MPRASRSSYTDNNEMHEGYSRTVRTHFTPEPIPGPIEKIVKWSIGGCLVLLVAYLFFRAI